MFIIFVYQPSDSGDNADGDGPLFTFSNCAAFMMRYKDKTKRYTLRGDNGCTITSLTMIHQEQMVTLMVNGWFLRERNTFESHLKSKFSKTNRTAPAISMRISNRTSQRPSFLLLCNYCSLSTVNGLT